jgi:hypothetical protein
MKEDELKSKRKSLWSLQDHLEYLKVNGVNQHQDSELIDGIRGNDVSDATFSLIGYPIVDGHSGLLCIFLRRTGNKLTHLCYSTGFSTSPCRILFCSSPLCFSQHLV